MVRRCLSVMCGLALLMGLAVFAWAGEGRFYWDSNYRGKVLKVYEGQEKAGLGSWNDKISSYQIDEGVECVITKNSKFGGDYKYLRSGTEAAHMPRGWNDKVSSIKCEQAGFFTQNSGNESAAYEHAHYAGRKISLTMDTRISNLKSVGMNDKISSARVARDANFACKFYKDSNYRGELFTLLPGYSYNRLSRYGFDNKVSSIKCYPYDQ